MVLRLRNLVEEVPQFLHSLEATHRMKTERGEGQIVEIFPSLLALFEKSLILQIHPLISLLLLPTLNATNAIGVVGEPKYLEPVALLLRKKDEGPPAIDAGLQYIVIHINRNRGSMLLGGISLDSGIRNNGDVVDSVFPAWVEPQLVSSIVSPGDSWPTPVARVINEVVGHLHT